MDDRVRFCVDCKPTVQGVADGIKDHTSGYDAELDKLHMCGRWVRLRKTIICRDPICRRCDLRVSEIVDHVVPAREAISQVQLSKRFPFERYAGYFLSSNLQGLCRSCHGRKTLEDKAHIGEWPDIMAQYDAAPKRVYSF